MSFELSKFLVEAKKKKYRELEESNLETSNEGVKFYEFKENSMHYQERVIGKIPCSGQEVVYQDGNPIWSMNYYGDILDKKINQTALYEFLARALHLVMKDMPYRGPSRFSSGEWSYSLKVEGTINNFKGEELVYYNNRIVYNLYFHGGCLAC